jgi:ADP-L-glycero-D-manno-heptose 6-epimerase
MVWDISQYKPASGLYNVGTGNARPFSDLGKATFGALHLEPNITYVDMPEDLRDKYQYFTEADMSKWMSAGLPLPATSLEEGIRDYVVHYLNPGKFF